ncbi:MAG: CBS domain-containing protein [Bacteroidota bacterium]
MNVLKPVSTIMTKQLMCVDPADRLSAVKELFDNHNIHHIPVVKYKKIVGIVSKTDYDQFLHRSPGGADKGDSLIEKTRLDTWKVKDIMTEGLAKIDSDEPIRTVLGLFKMNRFHAIPVVDKEELVGMVTTFDIIDALASEPIQLEDYKTAKA